MLEAVRDFAKRDAILCVDGQETLNYGRQTMPTFMPGHRLNSGPFGTMGVGLPFGVGAKVACPDKQVIVVHGDGSHGHERDGDRHRGAAQDPDPDRHQPERRLDRRSEAREAGPRSWAMCGSTRCARRSAATANTSPSRRTSVRRWSARQAEVDKGRVALINVRTDYRARFAGAAFSDYST